MIIWRGWGILPVVIAVITVAVGAALAEAVVKGWKIHDDWGFLCMAAIVLAGGLANWFIGRSLNRPLEQAGIGYWKRHWVLFIQMEWWSVVFSFAGAGMILRAIVGR